jgi:hypothetical protein
VDLTAERLRELLHYCPEMGIFTWRKVRTFTALAGSGAGGKNNKGYIRIKVDGKQQLAHRLVWLYVHGVWPEPTVDHINRRRDDNRLVNLRLASYAHQRMNAKLNSDNSSGYPGISWNKRKEKWKASIGRQFLGYFADKESAIIALNSAFDARFGPEWRPNGS